MASRGTSITITYVAWDTGANAGKTGDAANHTLRVVKDGVSAAPTNAPAEVDATNAPGVYKLTLTATEATADVVVLTGVSATANVSIIPVTVTFETVMRGTDNAALASVATEARLAELDAANIPTDLANIIAYVDSLETRLTAARAGYLDNLNGHTPQTGDSYARLGAPAAASIAADLLAIDNFVDELESRLTAVRAGYLDNLSAGAVAQEATVAALNDVSSADVQTAVAAELDAAGSELASIPTTTGTLRQKINFLFQYFRNRRTNTATTQKLYKEDGTTQLGSATVSDDGTTFDKGEMS